MHKTKMNGNNMKLILMLFYITSIQTMLSLDLLQRESIKSWNRSPAL